MPIQSKKIVQEPKPLFAGIDVGADELILVIRKNGTPYKPQKFANAPADRARLVKKLVNLPGIIVCLEATGVYHFDLSIALHDAGVAIISDLGDGAQLNWLDKIFNGELQQVLESFNESIWSAA